LGATSAIILGGTGSVSPAVEQAVRDMGLSVERVAGTSRYATAAAVARKLGGTRAYLVEGANANASRGWPDAVSVSGLAAALGRPVLLATTGGVPGETMDVLKELGVREVTVVGGVNALPDSILDPIREFATVNRIAGDSRYTTSLEVAKAAVKAGLSADGAVLTTGGNWPDALAGGPAAAELRVFSVLVPPDSIDSAATTRDWLASSGPDTLNLVGGPNSISYAIESWANAITK
jgi:putative cell wall-binding protein